MAGLEGWGSQSPYSLVTGLLAIRRAFSVPLLTEAIATTATHLGGAPCGTAIDYSIDSSHALAAIRLGTASEHVDRFPLEDPSCGCLELPLET
jgi:hypothetical protein